MFEHVFEEVNVRAKSFTVYGVSRRGTTVAPERFPGARILSRHCGPGMQWRGPGIP